MSTLRYFLCDPIKGGCGSVFLESNNRRGTASKEKLNCLNCKDTTMEFKGEINDECGEFHSGNRYCSVADGQNRNRP